MSISQKHLITHWVIVLALSAVPVAQSLDLKPFAEKDLQKARELALKWHNIFRGWHNQSGDIPQAELKDSLNQKAQELAKSGENDTGVLILRAPFASNKSDFKIAESVVHAIKYWYYEICDDQAWSSRELNNFTQVVWKESSKIGIGASVNGNGSLLSIVATFDPVGNYRGEYKDNVKNLRCPKDNICKGGKAKYASGDRAEEKACPPRKTKPKVENFSEEDIKKAREVVLKWHNIFRAWHNDTGEVPKLELNRELNPKAQRIAKSGKNAPGVNIYQATHASNKSHFNLSEMAAQAVKSWYYQVCDNVKWRHGELNNSTKILWDDTTEIGVGTFFSSDGSKHVIAVVYDPEGNFEGEYDDSVWPLRCAKTEICDGTKSKFSSGDPLEERACPSHKTNANNGTESQPGDSKSTTDKDLQKAREVALKWHNIFREWHNGSGNVPRVRINEELNLKAQKIADEDNNPTTGANVFYASLGSNMSHFDIAEKAEQAVKKWYYETCDGHKFRKGEFNNFTQIVWSETTGIGMGVGIGNNASRLKIVVAYEPIGNVPEKYENGVKNIRCQKLSICIGTQPMRFSSPSEEESACQPKGSKQKKGNKKAGFKHYVGVGLEDARHAALNWHNFFRKWHNKSGNVKPLELDEGLNIIAHEMANDAYVYIPGIQSNWDLAVRTASSPAFNASALVEQSIKRMYYEICRSEEIKTFRGHQEAIVSQRNRYLGLGVSTTDDRTLVNILMMYGPGDENQGKPEGEASLLCPLSNICNGTEPKYTNGDKKEENACS